MSEPFLVAGSMFESGQREEKERERRSGERREGEDNRNVKLLIKRPGRSCPFRREYGRFARGTAERVERTAQQPPPSRFRLGWAPSNCSRSSLLFTLASKAVTLCAVCVRVCAPESVADLHCFSSLPLRNNWPGPRGLSRSRPPPRSGSVRVGAGLV